jgi:hypothetical protein
MDPRPLRIAGDDSANLPLSATDLSIDRVAMAPLSYGMQICSIVRYRKPTINVAPIPCWTPTERCPGKPCHLVVFRSLKVVTEAVRTGFRGCDLNLFSWVEPNTEAQPKVPVRLK